MASEYDAGTHPIFRLTRMSCRRFLLWRDLDESGVSGTGKVAEGVQFGDGTSVLRWCGAHKSTAVYRDLGDLEAIHGHGGKTKIVWLDRELNQSLDELVAEAERILGGA